MGIICHNSRIITACSGIFLFVLLIASSLGADTCENVRYYRISDDIVVIYYDLDSTRPTNVDVEVSLDGGKTFNLKPQALSGDVGVNVLPGSYKRITWEVYKDIKNLPEDFIVRVIASDSIPGTFKLENLSYSEEKIISASHIDSPVKLDGFLNEPFWKEALVASDFVQQEPLEGVDATEKTEVRVLYDEENLYLGVICFDQQPDKITHNELRVDGELESDDNFSVVLDTFDDKRGGFYFCTNPNGARLDGKLTGSRGMRRISSSSSSFTRRRFDVNIDWNGIWDVAAKVTEQGWSAEIVIPFKTLRFSYDEIQEWGINFKRDIARKNEQALWTSWSRDDGLMQLTKAGVLNNLKEIQRGSKIEFIPYTYAGLEKEEGEMDKNFKGGIDIKYPLTSDLTLDLTTYTDFAQIESDRTMINLTQFDIIYPEKRDFFLEGSEIFNFSSHFTTPFYSRNIGLTLDRELVPIIAGAKVTGKAGSYNLGILTMQTDHKDVNPSTNYSVVRIKKDIFEKSSIGIIATNLYDNNKHKDQTFGIDFIYKSNTFLKNKNLEISADLAENNSGADYGTRAGRVQVRYPNDILDLFLYYKNVGENYEPEMGFVQRNGVQQYMTRNSFSPRPNIPYIKQLHFVPLNLSVYNDMSGRLETREIEVSPFGFTTKTEDIFNVTISNTYEYLKEEFNIFRDITIPLGDYEWSNYGTSLITNPNRWVSMNVRYQWGDFYNGTKNTAETAMNVKFNRYVSFTSEIAYSDLTINARSFDTREYSLRLNTNVSTRLNARTYIQWNNEDKIANLNFRIHFIPQIGSDIYFVYNHLWDGFRNYSTSYNTGISKIAYRITF